LKNDESLFIKPSEFARALSLGCSKTYNLIAAGTIKSIDVHGSLRIPRSELQKWIDLAKLPAQSRPRRPRPPKVEKLAL
jgi:excisionase family DNA binding protein